MSTKTRLFTGFLLAVLAVQPTALFLRPPALAGATPLRGQAPEPVIMYATMMTKVNISFLDSKGAPVGPGPNGGFSDTPVRMDASVDKVPGASQITGYRLLFKEGYKGPDNWGNPSKLEPRKGLDLGMAFAGGTTSFSTEINYVNLPPSAFQTEKPTYSAVGGGPSSLPGQSGGSGGGASQAGGGGGGDGGITLNPYVNVPQWGNAATFKMPEFLMPHFTMPDFKLPDFSLPKFQTPEYQNPKFTMPAFAKPEFQMPKFDMPTFSMPTFSNFGGGSVGGSAAAGATAATSAIPVADLRLHKDFVRNLEGAEAYNVPVRVYLSGKVDTGWPVVKSFTAVGCVKAPESAKLEPEDLDITYSRVPPVVKQESKGSMTVTTYEGAGSAKPDKDGLFRLTFGDSLVLANRTLRFGLGRDTFTLKRGIRHDPGQPESEYTLVVNPTPPPLLRLWWDTDAASRDRAAPLSIIATITRPAGAAKTEGKVRLNTTLGSFTGGGGREYIAPVSTEINPSSVMAYLLPDQARTAIVTAEFQEARASIPINFESLRQGQLTPVYAEWPPRQPGLLYSTYVDSHCPGTSETISLPAPGQGAGSSGGSGGGAGASTPLSQPAAIAVNSYPGRLDWPAGSLTIEAEITNGYGVKGLMWGTKLSLVAVSRDVTGHQSDGWRLVTIAPEDLPKDTGDKIVFQIEREPNAVRLLIDGRESPVPSSLDAFMLNLHPGRATFWFEVETPVGRVRSDMIRVTVGDQSSASTAVDTAQQEANMVSGEATTLEPARPGTKIEFTYPAGESPKIFTEGWLLGAKATATLSDGSTQDISDLVVWTGESNFDPPQGKQTRPAFTRASLLDDGSRKVTITVEYQGEKVTATRVFETVNPRKGYARVGDGVFAPNVANGDPGSPYVVFGKIFTGSPTVLIGGLPAARIGDTGMHCCSAGSNTFEVIDGDPQVLIEGKAAARVNDGTRHDGGMGNIIAVASMAMP